MAECHPVAFQWVMEAKARGATVIHVDPRFTRTSAQADVYVPIRAGADIVFVGALINYVLRNDRYFRDYMLAYTNAATILTEEYADTEDLDGVFSGLNTEHRFYDFETWRYQGEEEVKPASGERQDPSVMHRRRRDLRGAARGEAHGSGGAAAHPAPDTDQTLQHPRCVFQVLKRHFARYTAEMVEQVCGIRQDEFARVCELVAVNSGRDRTTAFVYSLGWTQHTVGVQYIRTAAILQSLLGNMGRPGGGILALRGHASIQGSTDIPTLFDLLPGYLPMPFAFGNDDIEAYVRAESVPRGFWANTRQYLVSLLKAWWGDAATAGNDFCYDYLPRLTGSHSTYHTVLAQLDGTCKGYFLFGQNPAVGSANARMQRLGMANLDWLVVRDMVMIESATWWKDGQEVETGEMRPEDIGTEDDPDADAVLAEINGWGPGGRPLSSYTQLAHDGSTACGCWIYCGVRADGINQAARRTPWRQQNWVAPEWGWAWPANRRVLYNRASADPDGRPWSQRKALVWWDAEQGKWTGDDVPDFVLDRPPSYRPPPGASGIDAIAGIDAFIMQADGKAWLFAPAGVVDGPLPAHYEPQESPFPNIVYRQQHNPVRQIIQHRENRYQPSGDQPGSAIFPYVTTTYRLTEHHTAGGMSRFLPYLSELQPAFFCEVSPHLAAERGLEHLGWATIITSRNAIEARVLVTERIRALTVQGRTLHQVGLPWHWGPNGYTTGDAANDLAHLALDPNVHIQEVKALACDIRPGRRPRGHALRDLILQCQQRAGISDETGTEM